MNAKESMDWPKGRYLGYCEMCNQMTNHEKGICLKCKARI